MGIFSRKSKEQPPLEAVVIRLAPCKCSDWETGCECDEYDVMLTSGEPAPELRPTRLGAVRRTAVRLSPHPRGHYYVRSLDGSVIGEAYPHPKQVAAWPTVLGSIATYQAWLNVGREDCEGEPQYQWAVKWTRSGKDEILDEQKALGRRAGVHADARRAG